MLVPDDCPEPTMAEIRLLARTVGWHLREFERERQCGNFRAAMAHRAAAAALRQVLRYLGYAEVR